MQHKYSVIALFALLLTVAACGGKNDKKNNASSVDTGQIALAQEQGPGHDDNLTIPTDVEWSGHKYHILVERIPGDSLAQVKDRFGDPFLDNQVTITITRDGEALAKRVFTKALFAGQPEVASAKNLVLGGIAFSSVDERGFHFGAQLNLPGDDEGGLIYKLTLPLSAQGNPAIERDTNQDTSASDEVSD